MFFKNCIIFMITEVLTLKSEWENILVMGEQTKCIRLCLQLCCCRVVLNHVFVQPATISEVLLLARYPGRYSESYKNASARFLS